MSFWTNRTDFLAFQAKRGAPLARAVRSDYVTMSEGKVPKAGKVGKEGKAGKAGEAGEAGKRGIKRVIIISLIILIFSLTCLQCLHCLEYCVFATEISGFGHFNIYFGSS